MTGATIQAVTLRVFNLFSIGKKLLGDPVSYFPNLSSEFDDATFLYPKCYKSRFEAILTNHGKEPEPIDQLGYSNDTVQKEHGKY